VRGNNKDSPLLLPLKRNADILRAFLRRYSNGHRSSFVKNNFRYTIASFDHQSIKDGSTRR